MPVFAYSPRQRASSARRRLGLDHLPERTAPGFRLRATRHWCSGVKGFYGPAARESRGNRRRIYHQRQHSVGAIIGCSSVAQFARLPGGATSNSVRPRIGFLERILNAARSHQRQDFWTAGAISSMKDGTGTAVAYKRSMIKASKMRIMEWTTTGWSRQSNTAWLYARPQRLDSQAVRDRIHRLRTGRCRQIDAIQHADVGKLVSWHPTRGITKSRGPTKSCASPAQTRGGRRSSSASLIATARRNSRVDADIRWATAQP